MNGRTRREFLMGAGIACLSAAGCSSMRGLGAKFDNNKTVFLSDTHVAHPGRDTIWGPQPDYQNATFMKTVDTILAMSPLPRRVVVMGDVAVSFGYLEDYQHARPGIDKLKAAGIDVYLATGNHDHRDPMVKVFPECAERSPVKGRLVSVVDLGTADLLLLDSLHADPKGEGSHNPVAGELDPAQAEWLIETAKAAKRPFFVGAHHTIDDLKYKNRGIGAILVDAPFYSGYIHGHNHRWQMNWLYGRWGNRKLVRSVGLPSVGWWGDIGYAVMHASDDRAEITNVQSDFFYPRPLKSGETRQPEWDDIIRERNGETCIMRYKG